MRRRLFLNGRIISTIRLKDCKGNLLHCQDCMRRAPKEPSATTHEQATALQSLFGCVETKGAPRKKKPSDAGNFHSTKHPRSLMTMPSTSSVRYVKAYPEDTLYTSSSRGAKNTYWNTPPPKDRRYRMQKCENSFGL